MQGGVSKDTHVCAVNADRDEGGNVARNGDVRPVAGIIYVDAIRRKSAGHVRHLDAVDFGRGERASQNRQRLPAVGISHRFEQVGGANIRHRALMHAELLRRGGEGEAAEKGYLNA